MNRKTAREAALHILFETDFDADSPKNVVEYRLSREGFGDFADELGIYGSFPDAKSAEYIRHVVFGVCEHTPELDGYIERFSIKWNFARLTHMTKSIIRLCLFEIIYLSDVPVKSAINEAVEFAKKYEDEDIPKFINGVLAGFMENEGKLLGD